MYFKKHIFSFAMFCSMAFLSLGYSQLTAEDMGNQATEIARGSHGGGGWHGGGGRGWHGGGGRGWHGGGGWHDHGGWGGDGFYGGYYPYGVGLGIGGVGVGSSSYYGNYPYNDGYYYYTDPNSSDSSTYYYYNPY